MRQREIWMVDFAPKMRQEIVQKLLAIILRDGNLGSFQLKVVVEIKIHGKEMSRKYSLNSFEAIPKDYANLYQIKSIPQKRFLIRLGILSSEEFGQLELALMKTLDLL